MKLYIFHLLSLEPWHIESIQEMIAAIIIITIIVVIIINCIIISAVLVNFYTAAFSLKEKMNEK